MYRVYLKTFNSQGYSEVDAESKTVTRSPSVAEAAFRELISREDLKGTKTHAVLSLNNQQLMYHRFDRLPGYKDYVAPDAEIRLYHD